LRGIGSQDERKVRGASWLSAKGPANIPRNIYEIDFILIIGEDRYQCPSLIAAFLSRIGQLQVTDSTLRQFIITAKDPEHYFHNFICLGESCRMTLTDRDSGFLQSVCCGWWDRELLNYVFEYYEDDTTCDDIFDRLTSRVAVPFNLFVFVTAAGGLRGR
jgi:hypothetical protein